MLGNLNENSENRNFVADKNDPSIAI